MKIIKTDNFNREFFSDEIIANGVTELYGAIITTLLNQKLSGDSTPYYFRLVPDDYKLYKFEP